MTSWQKCVLPSLIFGSKLFRVMDRMTKEQRHRCMSHVRSKNTRPELTVRQLLFAMGYRYRLHSKKLPGKPDIVLPRHKKVIFIHGCFWHGHNCEMTNHTPQTHTRFWKAKFQRNKERDATVLRQLWEAGWKVLVIWECETKAPARLRQILTDFLAPASPTPDYPLDDLHTLYAAEESVFTDD